MSKKRSHSRGARVQMGAREVVRLAEVVRAAFARQAAPGDLDDVQQEAALWVLETLARGHLDPGMNPWSYLYRVALRRAAVSVARALSPVSLSKGAAESGRARDYAHRIPVDGCGYQAGDEDVTVAVLASPCDEEDRGMAAIRGIVADHLAGLRREDQRAVGMLLGIGAPAAANAAEVAWRTKVAGGRLRAALRRVRAGVEQDPRWRALQETE